MAVKSALFGCLHVYVCVILLSQAVQSHLLKPGMGCVGKCGHADINVQRITVGVIHVKTKSKHF